MERMIIISTCKNCPYTKCTLRSTSEIPDNCSLFTIEEILEDHELHESNIESLKEYYLLSENI